MQVMECVSTWPLLQRNKIEDSKINLALQAIAGASVPEDEIAVADGVAKPEKSPKPQGVKTEPSEPTNLESAEADVDQPQSVKSEDAAPADESLSTDSVKDVTPMTVDEPNPDCERGRTTEGRESQATKLRRLATKVIILRSVQFRY